MGDAVFQPNNLAAGVFSAIASAGAAAIYLFGFANQSISLESLFWAMPMLSLIAFLVYLRSRTVGVIAMLVLYAAAILGANQIVMNDCLRGNCPTTNRFLIFLSAMVSGLHMISMLIALLLMCRGWLHRSPHATENE
jgi:hypothetical protein